MTTETEQESEPQINPGESFSGRGLLGMSLLSFVVYGVLALAIFYWFHEDGWTGAFERGESFTKQLLTGGLAGCLAAGAIMFLAGRSPVIQVLNDYTIFRTVKGIRFTSFDRIQISLFAGVGEELLFRGAIQPLLGVWLTSVIFVGIHGYFKFRSTGHILFGAMMFGLSVLLGFLFEYAGLIAAMFAHAVYDVVMLWWVSLRRGEWEMG